MPPLQTGNAVVIADTHPLYITGIKNAFKNKNMELVPACTMQEITDQLSSGKYKCLVLTDTMLAECGRSCIGHIREKFNDVKIIVLIHTRHIPVLKNLVASGVSGLVSRLTRGREIEDAILHVQEKESPYYCQHILKQLAEKTEIPQYVNGKKVSLSEQLVQVLLYIIDTTPHKTIATEMELTEETVKGYCKTVNKRIRLAQCKSPLEYGVKTGYFNMEEYIKKITKK